MIYSRYILEQNEDEVLSFIVFWKVDGMMVWIASCSGIVWAVSANGDLWYRAGICHNNPMGTNWFKMETWAEI